MKFLTLIPILLCVACAHAGSIVTLTITVTNTPSAGDTITVNSVVRTNVASVATAANEILIGANIGACTTNMFNQFASYGFTTLSLNRSSSNIVTLRGIVDQTISASASGTWATLTLSTNTTTNMVVVMVPATSVPVQSKATNIISELVRDIGTHSTNSIPAAATALAHHANLTTAQTLSNKTLVSATMSSGTLTNVTGGFTNIWTTNLYVYGAFDITNTAPTMNFKDTDAAADEKNYYISAAGGFFSLGVYDDAASSFHTVLVADRTGTTLDYLNLQEGQLRIDDSIKNTGTSILPFIVNSSLANGNNSAIVVTAKNTKLTAGPTAAFAICGIAGGEDGREITIYNSIAQNMTIANDSGTDPTPANRIYTLTGSDIATSGVGAVTLVYDATASRWIVTSFRD